MMQMLAIVQDSIRELRSRSLFWISLAVSAIVAILLFGVIGFDEHGWKMLWFTTNESDILYKGSDASRSVVSWLFGGVFVFWWLSWGAIILALISTSSTVPDLIGEGSIDITLAKPLSRTKLYLTKLAGATLFMIAQLTLGVTIAYVLAGLRFGIWFHGAWLAIPLLTLQFLYLFIPMSYVGLRTRSPMASVILVMIFWGLISVAQFAANQVDKNLAAADASVALGNTRIAALHASAKSEQRELSPFEQGAIDRINDELIAPNQKALDLLEPWQGRAESMMLTLPKTADIQRIIGTLIDAPTFTELIFILQGGDPDFLAEAAHTDRETAKDMQAASVAGEKVDRHVNAWLSIATSLGLTGIFLVLSLWNFCRRDF